jgi:hypothetical protein
MERPKNTSERCRVTASKGDALLVLLHSAAHLSFCDILVLAGEVAVGRAPIFRIGSIVDEEKLAYRIDARNPDPKAPTSAPSAENSIERTEL